MAILIVGASRRMIGIVEEASKVVLVGNIIKELLLSRWRVR